jgi:predicted AlkP superfamily phosphohydrolase/phosphomutase
VSRNKKSLFVLILLLAVAVSIWHLTKNVSRGPQPGTATRLDDTYEFKSMEQFLRGVDNPTNHQVVFIGLDGATWNVIDPMIESGLLPTFERLKEEGSWGVLRSVDCYFSPPAWTSMMTGFSPENTGVYTFGKWIPEEREFRAVSSLDVEVPHVWDIASNAGKRVAVTNVPLTYPARAINGIMVSGLMTPIVYDKSRAPRKLRFREVTAPFDKALDTRSYAPKMLSTMFFSLKKLVFVLYDTVDDNVTQYDTVALKVFPPDGGQRISDEAPLYTFSLDQYSPWFHIDYLKRTPEGRREKEVVCSVRVAQLADQQTAELKMTPLLRPPSDPEIDLTFPKSLGEEIEKEFGYYLITMTYSSDLIPQGTEATAEFASYFYDYDDWDLFFYVFQATDNVHHAEGAGDMTVSVYETIDQYLARLIDRLPEDVTLILASDHGFAEYKYIIGLNDYFEELGLLTNPARIDHDNTLVFHNQWCLYFNHDLLTTDELERRGIPIAPGQTPRQAFITHLKERCAELKFDDLLAMPIELIEVPEDALGVAPDMIVKGSYPGYFIEGADTRIHGREIVRETSNRVRWFHDQEGMYLMWGNQIRSGLDGGERGIEDITPTILYLLDLPLAENFDGKVMEEIIRPEVASSKPRYYIDDYLEQMAVRDYTFEERESLEEKLRTLGYVR